MKAWYFSGFPEPFGGMGQNIPLNTSMKMMLFVSQYVSFLLL